MKNTFEILFFFIFILVNPTAYADQDLNDKHIRQIVNELLQEKDSKIQHLEARIFQLEQRLQTKKIDANQNSLAKASNTVDNEEIVESSWTDKIVEIEKQVEDLKSKSEDNGLQLTGFFDFNARTKNTNNNTFNLGAVEVDLEYDYGEYFAASSALVWDGGTANIGVALVDFHMFNHSIPARGRIFSGQGFHIQAGRFDLPFSIDYQYFAAPDRVTISAPMTTQRIQKGGYNGDGVRLYGAWDIINYSLFWTNSVYESSGTSFGGRLGLSLGQNSFRMHHSNSMTSLELGLSQLTDLDGNNNARRSVYAADFDFSCDFVTLQGELAWLNSHEILFDANQVNLGRPNEFAYHTTLITDLEGLLHYPVKTYIRYGQWNPSYVAIIDAGNSYATENITRLTFGLNYSMNDYLQMKIEYSDSLGSQTQEPGFEKQLATAQLVVAY